MSGPVVAGDRVRKVQDGRAIPLGTLGTVEWTAGPWVAVRWEGGYGRCAVRFDGVEKVEEASDAST